MHAIQVLFFDHGGFDDLYTHIQPHPHDDYCYFCALKRDKMYFWLREKYEKHRRKSEKAPEKYMSLIIDGMDQGKTDIPHITSNPKALAGAYKFETHVTGVRVHGRGTVMVVDCGQFAHNSNMTIDILLRTFHIYKVL